MIITAIYDKKTQTIGKPIFQRNIEEAIQGVKDALNSIDQMGNYLMPNHREHPEDYKLIKLGNFIESKTGEKYTENIDNTGFKKEIIELGKKYITTEEEDVIEFKDIELQDKKLKVDAEMIYSYCQNTMEKIKQEIADYKIMYAEFTKNIETKFDTQKELFREIIRNELEKKSE